MNKVQYIPHTFSHWSGFEILETLLSELRWEQRDAPRREAFLADRIVDYTYGSGLGQRTYTSELYPEWFLPLLRAAEAHAGCRFELCFLNHYKDGRDHLGWHSDDSPEVDPERPIAVMTFGAVRQIWFRVRPELPPCFTSDACEDVGKTVLLGDGSLLIMPAGFQQAFQHRIPKADNGKTCGPRVSLTFRGLARS